MSTAIAKRAMLVSLSVSTWTGRKLDKQATAEVNDNHGAKSDAGRYNKLLLPKEALDPINKVVSATRSYLYANTLPWRDNGDRVLLSTNYFKHMEKIRDFNQQFNDEVDNFAARYGEFVEKARFELNSLFKAEDYPDIEDVRRKFGFFHQVSTLPIAKDFRVEIGGDEVRRIQEQIEEDTNRYATQAMDSVWKQMQETVAHLADRLRDPKAKFHSTTVTNIEDLIERVPHLNLTEDVTLDQFAKEIKDCLVGYTAKELKDDPTVRAGVAKEADRIGQKMAGLFA